MTLPATLRAQGAGVLMLVVALACASMGGVSEGTPVEIRNDYRHDVVIYLVDWPGDRPTGHGVRVPAHGSAAAHWRAAELARRPYVLACVGRWTPQARCEVSSTRTDGTGALDLVGWPGGQGRAT